jgi:hypothetical protein
LSRWCDVADARNPWPELVAAARADVQRANRGNKLVAQRVLQQAAIGLREVLSGRQPDLERLEYLGFLLTSLEQIGQGVSAEKALGLWSSSRPNSISDSRDLVCFVRVGLEFDQQRTRSVAAAIGTAAKRLNLGKPTVEKAWKKYGGKRAWLSARNPDVSSGK